MKNFLVLFFTVLIPSFSTFAVAADDDCSCELTDDSKQTLFEIETKSEKQLKLLFPVSPITTAKAKIAYLCMDEEVKVTKAKLWMPSMGHGSSATKLVAHSENCTIIRKINFLMTGDWEIQVTLEDKDEGVFAFEVEGKKK